MAKPDAQVQAAVGFLTLSTFKSVFPSLVLHFKDTKAPEGTKEAWLKHELTPAGA